MLFLEKTSPPPFWQEKLTDKQRLMYDKAFIGTRSQRYYLKRFAEFDTAGRLSAKWHWASFFATFGWLLYRKRFLDSLVYVVAGWSFIQLNVTIILVMLEFAIIPFVPEDVRLWVRLGVGGVIWLFWASMVARWADAYYYRMARREIADAIEMYPRDEERQIAHLRQHGGASNFGLALAFGFLGFALMVINVQFLPIYSKHKANEVIAEVWDITHNAQNRVEAIYHATGQCPVNTPLTTDNQKVTLKVMTTSEAIPAQILANSHCVVQSQVVGIGFPNRWLNGQTMTMYRIGDSKDNAEWGCVTSLNKKQIPKGCAVVEK